MSVLEALFLGIFQGVTEFLPISSSGHLVLAEHFFGLEEESLLLFDGLLHGGSFLALVFLFWREILEILRFQKLFLYVLCASLPTGIMGVFFQDHLDAFRDTVVVAVAFFASALLFFAAEYTLSKKKTATLTPWSIAAVAVLQIFSLFPGISRSGTVAATQLFFGIPRAEAMRFAFLAGLPLLGGVLLLSSLTWIQEGFGDVTFWPALVALLSSTIVSYLTARFLLSFFQRFSLTAFAVYLLLAGATLLLW